MAIKIVIGNNEFKSKKAAKECVREIINSYDMGTEITSEIDLNFLFDLFEMHPEFEQKKGVGIKAIKVDLDKEYRKNKCFFITRKDNSSTDISWLACIDGRNIRKEIIDGFRNAISDQTMEFKKEKLKTICFCPYREIELNNDNSDVDHEKPTFNDLYSNFLKEQKLDIKNIKISKPKDNQYTTHLTDKELVNKWKTYHKNNAKLRLLSKEGNLSDAKRKEL